MILHIDRLCSGCGNCATFCPYTSAPAQEKFTLFTARDAFEASGNPGFLPLEGNRVLVRLDGQAQEIDLDAPNDLPADIETFILTVQNRYRYLY